MSVYEPIGEDRTIIETTKPLDIGIRVLDEVGFNNFVHGQNLFLARLDVLFLKHEFSFSVILACNLRDGTATRRQLKLDLVSYFFKIFHQGVAFQQRIVVCELVFTQLVNVVLHTIKSATYMSNIDDFRLV